MFCTSCGAALRENAKFCVQCGAPVHAAPAPVVPAVPAPAAPVEDPEQRAFRDMRRSYQLSYLGGLITYGVQKKIASAILSLLMSIVMGGLYSVMFSDIFFGNGDLELFDRIRMLGENRTFIFAALAVYAVVYTVGLAGGIAVSKVMRRRLTAVPPEVRPLSVGKFLLIALACFGVWGVGALVGNFPAFFVPVETADFGWASAPMWFVTVLVAPIAEELIFRKFMLDRMRVHGERYAVLATALIFGMAHQNGMQFFLAFGVGIIFALVYLRTGKIVYTMLLHGMINLFATLGSIGCLCFGDVFDRWWMIAAGVLTVGGIVVLIVFRKRIPRPAPELLSDARRAAFGGWGMTLCKVIVLPEVVSYGLVYAGLAFASTRSMLSLLYLVPAALCFAAILIVSRKGAPAVPADVPYEDIAALSK